MKNFFISFQELAWNSSSFLWAILKSNVAFVCWHQYDPGWDEMKTYSYRKDELIVLCSDDTDVYLMALKLEKWHQKWEICFHTVFNELAVWFCIVRTSEGDNALIFPVWSRPARIYWQHSFIFSQVEVCVCETAQIWSFWLCTNQEKTAWLLEVEPVIWE